MPNNSDGVRDDSQRPNLTMKRSSSTLTEIVPQNLNQPSSEELQKQQKDRAENWQKKQIKIVAPVPTTNVKELTDLILQTIRKIKEKELKLFEDICPHSEYHLIRQILFLVTEDMVDPLANGENKDAIVRFLILIEIFKRIITETLATKEQDLSLRDVFSEINPQIDALKNTQKRLPKIQQRTIIRQQLEFENRAKVHLAVFPRPQTPPQISVLVKSLLEDCQKKYDEYLNQPEHEDYKEALGWIALGLEDLALKIPILESRVIDLTEVTLDIVKLVSEFIGFFEGVPPWMKPNRENVDRLEEKHYEFLIKSNVIVVQTGYQEQVDKKRTIEEENLTPTKRIALPAQNMS